MKLPGILTVLALVLTMFSVVSEASEAGHMSVGPLVGINYSQATNQLAGTDSSAAHVTGFMGGFEFEYAFNNMFYLAPEVYYISKTTAVTNDNVSFNYQMIYTYNYVEVPVLLKVKFGSPRHNSRLYVDVGPRYSFKTFATSTSGEVGIPFNPASSDVGAVAGFGGDFLFNGKPCFAQLNYSMGFTNQLTDANSLKMNTVMLTVGTLFSL